MTKEHDAVSEIPKLQLIRKKEVGRYLVVRRPPLDILAIGGHKTNSRHIIVGLPTIDPLKYRYLSS